MTRVCILCDTSAFMYYWMRTLITRPKVWKAVVENSIRRTSYHSWMMQGSAKSSLLYCHSGMNALVGPRCTLHAFPRLPSYSPITSAPEKRTFRGRFALRRLWRKNPLPRKSVYSRVRLRRKHNYTNELSFTGRPARYSEIHIYLDLQRHGIQVLNMVGCWQDYVFCVTPLLSSPTECEHW